MTSLCCVRFSDRFVYVFCVLAFALANAAPEHSGASFLDCAAQAQSFSPFDRAWVMVQAGEVALPIEAGRTNSWAKAALDLARHLPHGSNQAAMEKNALRGRASHDPNAALALYRPQDVLKPDESSQDPRALTGPKYLQRDLGKPRPSIYWKAPESRDLPWCNGPVPL
jgi:hypothetical protein